MRKTSSTNGNDVDYVPDMGDDSESDHQQVAIRSKKQHHSHYIAPLSMNKFANLAKQNRVIAPKVSQKVPLDSNATKEKHSKATITMAELLLGNKGPQRRREVFKENLTKPNYINGGAKRRLVLVDEDDDEYDEPFQGIIYDVDQNDEYEDMDDMAFVDNENEIHMDDSDNDLGNEDDVVIQERLQGSKLEKTIESKKRGSTMLHVVHTRKADDREIIICNEFGQPVGPVTNEKDVVGRFSRFLGTIARNHSYAPLIHSSWHKCHIKIRYGSMSWYINADLKNNISISLEMTKQDGRIVLKAFQKDFAQLLRLWNNTNVKKRCLQAKEIRMSQKNMHTAGPKSFARIRDEMEQMKNCKSLENESASVDPFTIVMNKENSGYCRLYGRGVTNILIKKINSGDTTCTFPGGLIESFNSSFEGQKHELLEMRKELDEEHERKKTELEAIQLDIKNQQEHLEATMRKLMEQLPRKD
ncbi:hypothetical protein E3N88_07280 [Mikania micrantha]|uniref:Uncharacterized protein n=1 Tax=Mikania micrantha TaxID=192012 RepID=A0A5N6PR40_9ASTR|nr:hypothetical protein E3N88_07280 [Mikania micrantha]